jgi:hypothetical protein
VIASAALVPRASRVKNFDMEKWKKWWMKKWCIRLSNVKLFF